MSPTRAVRTARRDNILFVLIVSALGTGCGGGDQAGQAPPAPPAATGVATPAAPPVDACTLLTKAEVEAIVGRPVLEPVSEAMADMSNCGYPDPTAPAAGVIPTVASISVFSGGDAAAAKGVFDIARSNAAEVQAVSGVGEDAYWDGINRYFRTHKGRYQVDVNVDSKAGLDIARALAEKALQKLPN